MHDHEAASPLIISQWTNSLNFNLVCLGAFVFSVVGYLMFTSGHYAQLGVALAMALVFAAVAFFFTTRRNLKVALHDQHIELQRFPYVAAKTWRWNEIRGIHVDDEYNDQSLDKSGEALYLHDIFGKRVLVAHRAGARTELRQMAAEIRRRIA